VELVLSQSCFWETWEFKPPVSRKPYLAAGNQKMPASVTQYGKEDPGLNNPRFAALFRSLFSS
jgi:hypothetical protein